MNKTYAVIIPARYNSSRFPGKPLVNICGKAMIQHVWERCCKAVCHDQVYVATDHTKIKEVVESFGGKVIMTRSDCLTGTDRLAEANFNLDYDFVVNVQGDEPLIDPNDIKKLINSFIQTGHVTNGMTLIKSEDDFRSTTIPKVVTSKSKKLLYMSRSPIPVTKSNGLDIAYKQVCIYVFSRDQLNFFASQKSKTPNEKIEDIEILRFIENDIPVSMVELQSSNIAVDTPYDLEKVINILNSKNDENY